MEMPTRSELYPRTIMCVLNKLVNCTRLSGDECRGGRIGAPRRGDSVNRNRRPDG